jgi:hypothetical protein
MKYKIKSVLLALCVFFLPAAAFAQILPPYPDVLTCLDDQGLSIPTLYISTLGLYGDTNQFGGTPPGPDDLIYYNPNGSLAIDTATGLVDTGETSLVCTTPDTTSPLTSISDFPSYNYGGSSSTSTPPTGGYSPSEDEFLFIFGLFLFIGSIPFWNFLVGRSGIYDV